MNNRRLYRKLYDIEKRFDQLDKRLNSEKQNNKVAVFLSFTLALVAISVNYIVGGDIFSGLVLLLFAAFFLAYLVIQQVKSLKYVMLICLIVAFLGIAVYAFGSLIAVLYKVGNIVFASGVLTVCIIYALILRKPRWFNNHHNKLRKPRKVESKTDYHPEKKDFISLVPTYFVAGGYVIQHGIQAANNITLGLGVFLVILSLLSLYVSLFPLMQGLLEVLYTISVSLGAVSILLYVIDWAGRLTEILSLDVATWVGYLFSYGGVLVILGLFVYHFRNIWRLFRQYNERRKPTGHID